MLLRGAEAIMTKERSSKPKDPALQNEGEGSRTAARRYDAGAERAANDKARTQQLAKGAEQALRGPEGKTLREAEQRAKEGKHR
jgi:hypothetical protein